MKYHNLLFIALVFNSPVTSQESIRLEFGNGVSSLSDFSIKVQGGKESFQVDIKRLRSSLRGLNLELQEGYNSDFIKLLLNVASASGDEINIRPQNNEELPTIEIGKISYSLDDWDINLSENGPLGVPTLNAKISLQRFNLIPPKNFTNNLSQNEWNIFKVFYEDGLLSIKKISVDLIMNEDRLINLSAQIDLPVGKAAIKSIISLPIDYKGDPYIESTEIDLISLTPGLREIIDEFLINSNEIPIKKKGTGYQLRFRGQLENPRFY